MATLYLWENLTQKRKIIAFNYFANMMELNPFSKNKHT